MIKIEDRQTSYFDVDDTLVMWDVENAQDRADHIWIDGHCLVPHMAHIRKLKGHRKAKHIVVVWSAGGSDWAEQVINALNLQEYVDLIVSKPDIYYDDLRSSEFLPGYKRKYLNWSHKQ